MKLNLGDYKIESDSNCFILKAKRIVKEGRLTKEENIGEERWVAVGYYSNMDKLIEALPRRVALDNDDIKTIVNKIEDIKIELREIKSILKGVINLNE